MRLVLCVADSVWRAAVPRPQLVMAWLCCCGRVTVLLGTMSVWLVLCVADSVWHAALVLCVADSVWRAACMSTRRTRIAPARVLLLLLAVLSFHCRHSQFRTCRDRSW